MQTMDLVVNTDARQRFVWIPNDADHVAKHISHGELQVVEDSGPAVWIWHKKKSRTYQYLLFFVVSKWSNYDH